MVSVSCDFFSCFFDRSFYASSQSINDISQRSVIILEVYFMRNSTFSLTGISFPTCVGMDMRKMLIFSFDAVSWEYAKYLKSSCSCFFHWCSAWSSFLNLFPDICLSFGDSFPCIIACRNMIHNYLCSVTFCYVITDHSWMKGYN